jgi:hypothetical protein
MFSPSVVAAALLRLLAVAVVAVVTVLFLLKHLPTPLTMFYLLPLAVVVAVAEEVGRPNYLHLTLVR